LLRFTMRLLTEDGDATCARCLAPIEREQRRVVASPMHLSLSAQTFALHPACALDVDTQRFCQLLATDAATFEGRAALEALAATRTRSIDDRRGRRWNAFNGSGIGIAPTIAPDAPVPPVSPARDPLGRPRVRVCIHGTENVLGPSNASSLWQRLRVLQSWPSPKREYVFYDGELAEADASDDPAQPTVAHVYATIAKKSSLRGTSVELWRRRALGFPPPLLWLIGIKQWKKTDRNVLDVREHLASFGLDPDESPVLCAPRIDHDALDALVLALDEHFDGRELPASPAASMALTLALAFERELREGPAFDRKLFVPIAALTRRGFTQASVAVNERSAARLVANGALHDAATLLVPTAHESSEPFESWFAAALASDEARTRDKWLIETSACSMIRAFAAKDRPAAVRAGLALLLVVENTESHPLRVLRLREALSDVSINRDVAAIRAAIDAARSDAHRSELALLLRAVEAKPP
jgi:hypothetical protein